MDTCGTGEMELELTIYLQQCHLYSSSRIKVVKHGNRSVSSKCGSADVLEALGANINLTKQQSESNGKRHRYMFPICTKLSQSNEVCCISKTRISFRTIFNILGPLANPAKAKVQIMGVYDEEITEKMAHVLKKFGCKKSFGCSWKRWLG